MLEKNVNSLVTTLNDDSRRTDPALTVLTHSELAKALGIDSNQMDSTFSDEWAVISETLRTAHGWEAFHPQATGQWVFWNTGLLTESLVATELSNTEKEQFRRSLESRQLDQSRKYGDSRTNIGNREHVRLIREARNAKSNPGISMSALILLHQTLTAYTLSIGVAPLTYGQLDYMTDLSRKQIGRGVGILSEAGLWACLHGGISNRIATRFISLSQRQGIDLIYKVLLKR